MGDDVRAWTAVLWEVGRRFAEWVVQVTGRVLYADSGLLLSGGTLAEYRPWDHSSPLPIYRVGGTRGRPTRSHGDVWYDVQLLCWVSGDRIVAEARRVEEWRPVRHIELREITFRLLTRL